MGVNVSLFEINRTNKFWIIAIFIFILIDVGYSFGMKFEVIELDKQYAFEDQSGYIITNKDFIQFLEKLECEQINQVLIKINYNITFNGTPVELSNFIVAKCFQGKDAQKTYTAKLVGSTQDTEAQHKRHLTSSFSAIQSVISGTGTTTFETNTQVTITVTAKDLFGTNINSGGEVIYVKITNSCTKGVNFACVPDTGTYTVLTSSIRAQMADNNDGTYTYNYQVTRPETITIAVLLYTQGGVFNEFFPNTYESGNLDYNGTRVNINIPLTSQDVYPGRQILLSANFYFRFKSPTTGTLTFTVVVDDAVYMYIDDVLMLLRSSCCGSAMGSINAIKDQFYDVHLIYEQFVGPSELVMSWSYPGQPSIVVPSTSLYYPTYVSNSPFNVTVVCPTYYTEIITGLIPQCVYLCGNGIRDGDEQCDDRNTKDGDGCSSLCMVENGYACTGGSTTTKDACHMFSFTIDNTTSSNQSSTSGSSLTPTTILNSKQKLFTISDPNKWLGLALWLSVLLCLIFDIIQGFLIDKYPAGVYISIEHIQLLTILPIAGSYFTKIVNGLFRLTRFALLGFDVINVRALFNIDTDYSQANDTLEFLEFESGSGIVNILAFTWIGLSVMVIESVLYVMAKICCRSRRCCEKCTNFCTKCKGWMCLGYQIRYIMLGYILILISTISEINNSNSMFILSWWISIVIIILLITFLVFCFINWLYSYNDDNEVKIFDEFNKMLKNKMKAKTFSILFLFHRALFCAIICTTNKFQTQNKIVSLICIQGAYIVYLIIIRPFDSIKANINKIVCECSVLVVVVLMYVYCESSQWNNSTENVFMYLITCSSCMPCLTTAFALLVQVFKRRQSKITPKQNLETLQKENDIKTTNSKVSEFEENKTNNTIIQSPVPKSTDEFRIEQNSVLQHKGNRSDIQAEKSEEELDFDLNMGEQRQNNDFEFKRESRMIRVGNRVVYRR